MYQYIPDVQIELKLTHVSKQGISDYGLLNAYVQSEVEKVALTIK